MSSLRKVCVLLFLSVAVSGFAQTGGALGNGISSHAISMGDTTVASSVSPLEAMQGNPATLTELSGRSLDLSVTSMFATGSFTNSVSNTGTIATGAGVLPYGAFAMPLGSKHWKLGVSVAPDVLMSANWTYLDPPGGLGGTSYGLQQNKSPHLAPPPSPGVGY